MAIHSFVAFVASGTTRKGLLQILPQSAAGFLFGKNVAAKRLSDFYLAANLNFSTPSADAQCNHQCTMAQALKKFGIRDFAKMKTLAPIFSSQNYFR